MCPYPMCFLTTAPFFDSTNPLSLECLGRDLVCSTRSLSSLPRHRMVDKLAPVVGVKASNVKRKLFHHRFQHRQQPRFTDLRGRSHHLPLRHFIHLINVVHPFYSDAISLMHRVDSQVPRPALWV